MRLLKIVLVLVLVFGTAFTPAEHKFYVSITKVEYSQDSQAVQIISKIFIDDLEDVFQERYDPDFSLDETNKSKDVDLYLSKYLSQKIQVTVNGTKANLVFIGKEYDIETLVCYIEIPDIKSIESIEISNKVLFELFEEQQNIIHFKTRDGRRSVILEKENPSHMLKFN